MGQQADDGKGRGGFVTTFCGMSAGGDELFWRGVSDTSRQFGGDNLGATVEEQNGEVTTTGGCPRTPDWMASGRQVKCAAGGGGDGWLTASAVKLNRVL